MKNVYMGIIIWVGVLLSGCIQAPMPEKGQTIELFRPRSATEKINIPYEDIEKVYRAQEFMPAQDFGGIWCLKAYGPDYYYVGYERASNKIGENLFLYCSKNSKYYQLSRF